MLWRRADLRGLRCDRNSHSFHILRSANGPCCTSSFLRCPTCCFQIFNPILHGFSVRYRSSRQEIKMSGGTLVARLRSFHHSEDGVRPRDWQPRRSSCKVPFRLLRLCTLVIFLPSILIAGPMYLRYHVYSEQLYPLTVSDQRLIDARISTIWCQSQLIKANATFNAYLMSGEPAVQSEAVPVSMTRHLILEDDMKEYWGFYLLRGSSVTVSTCVRWPGASLTIIRGHKHLHECAFIGDDSSEELEELLETAQEQGLLTTNGTTEATSLSNVPEKMRRAGQDVHFHHEDGVQRSNVSESIEYSHQPGGSHELDAKALRNILTQILAKTLDMKRKKENPHHHYKSVFRESANIDKFDKLTTTSTTKHSEISGQPHHPLPRQKAISRFGNHKETSESSTESKLMSSSASFFSEEKSSEEEEGRRRHDEAKLEIQKNSTSSSSSSLDVRRGSTISDVRTETVVSRETMQAETENKRLDSAEMFQDVLRKISSLGSRGRQMLRKLMDEIDAQGVEGEALRRLVNETMNDERLTSEAKHRRRRDLVLSSPLYRDLTWEDEDGDAPLEEGMLNPDGIAEHRGTVNETDLNDRSNSEFWSSFSSSEERLLECKGLILNLPLTPHRQCTPKHESRHVTASFANTVTYKVPLNGYYFFVFNSENEIQPNYVRVQFDLLKTVYNTSNPVYSCKNSTKECSLPFNIFSNERTILEVPLSGNDSQWNEEYMVVSMCVPRTTIYFICVVMVPLLILCFAFQ
ncbi:PREDICTED: uncharacterized protein LOC106746578 [Dinoponera quadriceps]|uniref:Uncharacterized protein LOC106746578 n=1 Tax=Dinoponera quadriceps TaxID=609295 RepID=A0A6P3XLF4_DINQU|nr:PREDICTED: uncharacterized protein LOC106746578 [Dinoponera quadriceps]